MKVLLLALKTGWSITEIKQLPIAVFNMYLEKLTTKSNE